ncbi:phosphate starvation-inducible protein PhoH [Solibacillus sp. FSL R5-0691]|uniref:phosphate starvation-inducible protein PhoH n=1 Tax=Solibacillus sp. FSL R5-0691 TaxID=2921653 RepID=UPI0030D28CC8
MDALSILVIVLIITGMVVCAIKMRSLKDKIHDSTATPIILRWIIITVAWGVLSIYVVAWWLMPRLL